MSKSSIPARLRARVAAQAGGHCGYCRTAEAITDRRDAMALAAFEGTVENGQVRLHGDVKLPEHARVYVVVPGLETVRHSRVYSPRLAHPEHVDDFAKEVLVEGADIDRS
jgi:hypothetical protein